MKIKNFSTNEELESNLSQIFEELKHTIIHNLNFKQAKLLTFWLNDWNQNFLINENTFDPLELINYKRGNIVKAHLGYNVGSEQGGLHYGIVIDKNNNKSSNVITIIPLRSMKENEKEENIDNKYEIFLGNALLTDKIEYIEKEIDKVNIELSKYSQNTSDYIKYKKSKNNLEKELKNLHKGSVAIISQIRTISKLRIYEPIKTYHSLSRFVLDNENMKKIDTKIIELYINNI